MVRAIANIVWIAGRCLLNVSISANDLDLIEIVSERTESCNIYVEIKSRTIGTSIGGKRTNNEWAENIKKLDIYMLTCFLLLFILLSDLKSWPSKF